MNESAAVSPDALQAAADAANVAPALPPNPLARQIDYAFDLQEIDAEVGRRLSTLAKTARINGFRAGRIPQSVMQQRWGGRCLNEILHEKANARFSAELPNMTERPTAVPQFLPAAVVNDKNYQVQVRYEVFPEIKPPDFSRQTIVRPLLQVGDAEIDEMIAKLRRDVGHYTETTAAAATAQEHNRVTVDFSVSHNGEPPEESKDRKWVLRSPTLGDEITRQIIGATIGETRDIKLKHPDNHPEESLRGTEMDIKVTIKSIEELQLPPLNDEFYARFGVTASEDTNMETAFRQLVAARLKSEVDNRLRQSLHNRAMNSLIAATPPFPLPHSLVQMEATSMYEQMKKNAEQQGMSEISPQMTTHIYSEAARRVALGLIIADWRTRENVEVSEDDITARLNEIAASYENPTEFVTQTRKNERFLQALRLELIERQAAEWICQSAQTSEEQITLSQLFNENSP